MACGKRPQNRFRAQALINFRIRRYIGVIVIANKVIVSGPLKGSKGRRGKSGVYQNQIQLFVLSVRLAHSFAREVLFHRIILTIIALNSILLYSFRI